MQHPFGLEDKLILITGASSGIGEACAVLLSQLGARLILNGRNQERLENVHAKLESPTKHRLAPFDLQSVEDIPDWIKSLLVNRNLKLDGLVHSAGINKMSSIRSTSIKQINEIFTTNLYSSIMLMKACSSRSLTNDNSSFVFISSIAGQIAAPGNSIYGASKAAMNSMIKSAAFELSPRIRVNGIAPGLINTSLLSNTPNEHYSYWMSKHLLGIGEPEDVANAVAYLMSETSKKVTGTILTVDSGSTI